MSQHIDFTCPDGTHVSVTLPNVEVEELRSTNQALADECYRFRLERQTLQAEVEALAEHIAIEIPESKRKPEINAIVSRHVVPF